MATRTMEYQEIVEKIKGFLKKHAGQAENFAISSPSLKEGLAAEGVQCSDQEIWFICGDLFAEGLIGITSITENEILISFPPIKK